EALLVTGQIHRDQRQDTAGARAAFEEIVTKYPAAVLHADRGAVEASAAAMAKMELAPLEADGGAAIWESLLDARPLGYVSAERIGWIRLEVRERLAEL